MKKFLFYTFVILNCQQLVAQNVGVGTMFPNNGKFVIKNTGTNSGLVVNDSTTGISFGENGLPIIGFNNYYAGGKKNMADGFAAHFYFNPVSGTLFYNNTATTGTQGSLPVLTSRLSLNKDGEMGLGIDDAQAGLHIRGKSLLVDNAAGHSDVTLTASTNSIGGMVELSNNTGIRTVALRSGDGSGISGEMIFYDNTGTASTLELDGNYSASGRSRIIVDELQIKGGADFAEMFDVNATAGIEAASGMLVIIDENKEGKLMVSNKPYDTKVAGVISGANGIKPGMMMGHSNTIANGSQPVAISGRVYVNAETLSHAIKPGDLLTSSAVPGHVMKATDRKKSSGAIIGKAMSNLEAEKKGMILILISIQ